MWSLKGFLLLHLIMESNFIQLSTVWGQLLNRSEPSETTTECTSWGKVWDGHGETVRWVRVKMGFRDWGRSFQHTPTAQHGLGKSSPSPEGLTHSTPDESWLILVSGFAWAWEALVPLSSKPWPAQRRLSADVTPQQGFPMKPAQLCSAVPLPTAFASSTSGMLAVTIWLFSPLTMNGKRHRQQKGRRPWRPMS